MPKKVSKKETPVWRVEKIKEDEVITTYLIGKDETTGDDVRVLKLTTNGEIFKIQTLTRNVSIIN